MLIIFNKIKNGNTVTYECRADDGAVSKHDKNSIINEIRAGNVSNARIQDYKGQLIIRIKDNISTNSSNNTQSSSSSSSNTQRKSGGKRKVILALDLYKQIMKEFNIQREEEALAIGFDKYDLSEEIHTKYERYLAELSYKMASDIRRLADIENNITLKRYRDEYLKS